MKKNKYILFTAGRGPIECGLAVQGIQMRFRKFLESEELNYEIVRRQLGQIHQSIYTIVFRIELEEISRVDHWFGTIQWISKSPVRKYAKRKNWYIKCCEIHLPESKQMNLNDITIQSYKASGPGGQHRNKVETAIRIIHNPTGTIVTASDSKSKVQNKKSAIAKLKKALSKQSHALQQDSNLEEWSSKIEIQRGCPSKVFYGAKFTEV